MALEPGALEVLNVVNIRRPLAGTVEKIVHLQQEMEIHSRLKITGMINNTNLATATTEEELRDGYEMIREVSELTGTPVLYTAGKKQFLDKFLAEGHDPKYIGTPVGKLDKRALICATPRNAVLIYIGSNGKYHNRKEVVQW